MTSVDISTILIPLVTVIVGGFVTVVTMLSSMKADSATHRREIGDVEESVSVLGEKHHKLENRVSVIETKVSP